MWLSSNVSLLFYKLFSLVPGLLLPGVCDNVYIHIIRNKLL